MATTTAFDPKELESKVKTMYRSVAENPHGEYHFEMGRAMAERLLHCHLFIPRILTAPAGSIRILACIECSSLAGSIGRTKKSGCIIKFIAASACITLPPSSVASRCESTSLSAARPR